MLIFNILGLFHNFRAQRYKKETDYGIYEKSFVFLPTKLS